MFTGIVEELGEVLAVEPAGDGVRLAVRGTLVTEDLKPGDSIAVDGVCLTATEVTGESFQADVMPETLRRSTLGRLAAGTGVNLERAATLTTRLGGHLVQGHVDGVGTVLSRDTGDRWDTVRIELPAQLRRYVVAKGSVTVDGVSLTVAALTGTGIDVCLIPTTLRLTTLGRRSAGDPVNLEVDVLAKYVERLLTDRGPA